MLLFTACRFGQQQKLARGLPTPPAWALGPAADGWAGQAAQRRTPPGLNSARAAADASPPSIARSTAEIEPAEIGGVYKPKEPWKP
jgi:hypothetical protein